ncbi:hypothetical protein P8452_27704 [Trifolium repens]|nr:hypothetical protein P8452_27704 [Trifolium repens]
MNPNHRRSRHRKFPIGNVPSPPLFSILAPILLPSFNFSQGSISFLDRLAFREKWKTDIKFGSVYVLFCISSSTILVMDIEFLELQARDTLQNICTGPISNASFVRLSISVKSIWKIVDLFVMEFCSGNLMDEIKAKFHRHPDKLSLEQMQCRANNAEKEAELLKEQLDHLKDQFNECLHQKTEVEKKLATFSSQEVSSTGSNVLVKQLQQELQHYAHPCLIEWAGRLGS